MDAVVRTVSRFGSSASGRFIRPVESCKDNFLAGAIVKRVANESGFHLSIFQRFSLETLLEAELFGHEKGDLPMPFRDASEDLNRRTRELFFWMK